MSSFDLIRIFIVAVVIVVAVRASASETPSFFVHFVQKLKIKKKKKDLFEEKKKKSKKQLIKAIIKICRLFYIDFSI